jgi:hypothetical protein
MCNSIGAKAFHGPVRDGKGWFHLAMDTRRKGGDAVCWSDPAERVTRFGGSKLFGV